MIAQTLGAIAADAIEAGRVERIAKRNLPPDKVAEFMSLYQSGVLSAGTAEPTKEDIETAKALVREINKRNSRQMGLPNAQKKDWLKFRYTVDRILTSLDVYSLKSDPALLPSDIHRMTDVERKQEGIGNIKLRDDKSGYFAAIYKTSDGRYIYANRGSGDAIDFINNYLQGTGKESAQFELAINNAKMLTARYGDRISFTGHSLGGGLAAAQAIAAASTAVTFDASGVHEATVGRALASAESRVTAYNVRGEILSSLQDGGKNMFLGVAASLGLLEGLTGVSLDDLIGAGPSRGSGSDVPPEMRNAIRQLLNPSPAERITFWGTAERVLNRVQQLADMPSAAGKREPALEPRNLVFSRNDGWRSEESRSNAIERHSITVMLESFVYANRDSLFPAKK